MHVVNTVGAPPGPFKILFPFLGALFLAYMLLPAPESDSSEASSQKSLEAYTFLGGWGSLLNDCLVPSMKVQFFAQSGDKV